MRCLIRFLSRGPAGSLETRDRVFDGDVLTLGRATDQVLHLKDRRVALEHARLVRRDAHLVIQALAPAGVLVNGGVTRESRLDVGDVVQVGANVLRILQPPAGCDFAFSFELEREARADDTAAPAVPGRLTALGLGLRGWSWLLFLLVLTGGLLIPASGLRDEQWQAQLRESRLPDDQLWLSGPLADVHQVVSRQCEACHQEPFLQVRSEACLACHAAGLRQHAPGFSAVSGRPARTECTDCHREHDGSQWLVRSDDALCAGCHRDLPAVAGPGFTDRPATDFGRQHPEFRVSTTVLVAPGPPREATVQRALPGPGVFDPSGLKFPHDKHLAPEGLEAPRGNVVLACADCHQPEPGGARFRPVRMEQHCADCHRLDFDPANPERQVPHGEARRVLTTLVEYYSRRYLESFSDELATARPVAGQRRPGPPLTPAQREAALERARAEAVIVARDLIERRTCAVCHEVTVREDLPLEGRWQVRPVILTRAWMPAANFSHRAHGTELTPCATCHLAEASKDAADILMPVLADCRDCHGGSNLPRGARNLLASGCETCHSFHQPGGELWHQGPALEPVRGRSR